MDTLDTSGEVRIYHRDAGHADQGGSVERWRWSDLTTFRQRYVEAALSGPIMGRFAPLNIQPRFADLAPETLAAMLADCEAWIAQWAKVPDTPDLRIKADEGRGFWSLRQRNKLANFPPVTLHLDPSGKIQQRTPS